MSCQKGTGSTQPAPHLQLCCQHLLKAKPGLRVGRDNPDVFCKSWLEGGAVLCPPGHTTRVKPPGWRRWDGGAP